MAKFQFKKEIESEPEVEHASDKFWHILVVDDEPSVHDVTRLVLSKLKVFGRALKLHSAYSGEEAKQLLQSDTVFAMSFIDVVMESNNAGLELVEWIRNDLQNQALRIILRTGQPGAAPEEDVIKRYDINDYKSKTELTHTKMVTSVYAGIRGYRDIQTILRSLQAFKRLIESSTNILKVRDIASFANAALDNLFSLLDLESSSIYIVRNEVDFYGHTDQVCLASNGRFGEEPYLLDSIPADIRSLIEDVFVSKKQVHTDKYFVGYYSTSPEASSVLYIEFEDDPTHFNAGMAELFATNLALVFESLLSHEYVLRSQRELMYIVGDAVELRSKETGAHVKRVALLCNIIAEKMGMPQAFIEAIKVSAPLHDIGKIAIPENILHKPGKLDGEEWEVMKRHAEIGGTMLEKSDLPVAKMGARLAKYHHENWDGSGYPDGLHEYEIPIEARIMAIVDVIDALGAKRSYKEPWANEQILDFVRDQNGKKFDPALVAIVDQHFDELMEVRKQYPD